MISRILLAAALVVAGALPAVAQTVYDARDPLITERPRPARNIVPPSFPNDARRYNLQGEVMLVVCVDAAGKIVGADMTKSSGYPVLDEATLNWIRSGPKWEPAYIGDKAVAVCNYVFTYVWDQQGRHKKDPTQDYLAWDDIKAADRPSIATQVNGPIYPPSAFASKTAGPVRLSLCISPDGRVVTFKAAEEGLDVNLVNATASWVGRFTFTPGTKDGKPVGVCGFPLKYVWELPN